MIKIDKKITKYRVEKPEDKIAAEKAAAAVSAEAERRKESKVIWMHEKIERPGCAHRQHVQDQDPGL